MIFQHRQNNISPSTINATNYTGIEVDIRSSPEGLVFNHDRLNFNQKYPLLINEVKNLGSKDIILNVKESGTEEELIQFFTENTELYKTNFYFLDSQLPDILKITKEYPEHAHRFIIRVSDMETPNQKLLNLVNPELIWLDYSDFENFDYIEYCKFLFKSIDELSYRKLILVSPELYSLDYRYITDKIASLYLELIFTNVGERIGVCTKFPELFNRTSYST